MLLPAVHWLRSMNVGAASGALHTPDAQAYRPIHMPLSSSQGCFEAVHSPFAVLALETFPESFYSSSPFLVVIFQYMLTVQ